MIKEDTGTNVLLPRFIRFLIRAGAAVDLMWLWLLSLSAWGRLGMAPAMMICYLVLVPVVVVNVVLANVRYLRGGLEARWMRLSYVPVLELGIPVILLPFLPAAGGGC